MKILFLDTETGGLDPQKHHLLTIGVCVFDTDTPYAEAYSEEFAVWDDLPGLKCEPSALAINKIDLNQHTKGAFTGIEMVKTMKIIAKMMTIGDKKCIVGGHNLAFDIGFLKVMFERCGENWNDYFSHRILDTTSVLNFLSAAGLYYHESTSLDAALEYYKIPLDQGERHGALADAKYTALLFNRLLSEVKR